MEQCIRCKQETTKLTSEGLCFDCEHKLWVIEILKGAGKYKS